MLDLVRDVVRDLSAKFEVEVAKDAFDAGRLVATFRPEYQASWLSDSVSMLELKPFSDSEALEYLRSLFANVPVQPKGARESLQVFQAGKGDVLIWHANLLHGGSPIERPRCGWQRAAREAVLPPARRAFAAESACAGAYPYLSTGQTLYLSAG